MLEAVLIFATLMQRLEVEAVDETKLALAPAVTLRPTGPVVLRVRPRAS